MIFFEYNPKCFVVGIAHVVHDFIDGFAAGLEALFGGFNFHPLNIFVHRVGGRPLEPAFQIPATQRKLRCQLIDRYSVLKIGLDKRLRLFYGFVHMPFLPLKNGEGRLTFAVELNGKHLGSLVRPTSFTSKRGGSPLARQN